MALRKPVGRPDGVDDLMDLAVDSDHPFLTDAQPAALRLTDAFFANPTGLSRAERKELLRHFSPAGIVEMLFRLSANMMNKVWTTFGDLPEFGSIAGDVVT